MAADVAFSPSEGEPRDFLKGVRKDRRALMCVAMLPKGSAFRVLELGLPSRSVACYLQWILLGAKEGRNSRKRLRVECKKRRQRNGSTEWGELSVGPAPAVVFGGPTQNLSTYADSNR